MPRFLTCRLRDGLYYAVLSDGSIIEWSVYCKEKAQCLTASTQ